MRSKNFIVQGKIVSAKILSFTKKIAHCSKNRVVGELVSLIVVAVYTFASVACRLLMEETIETPRAIAESIARHDPASERFNIS